MEKFEFDLEEAEQELDNVENLLSVFWGFFNEERPLEEELNTTAALWFVQSCKPYDSVILAAWDKIRKLHAEMESAINNHYHGDKQKGGEAA